MLIEFSFPSILTISIKYNVVSNTVGSGGMYDWLPTTQMSNFIEFVLEHESRFEKAQFPSDI